MLHVWNLNVADGSTFAQCLKFRFKAEFAEGIDFFSNAHVIAVGNVVLVGYTWNNAKTLLKTLGKLVGGAFKGSTVDAEANISILSPMITLGIHITHNL